MITESVMSKTPSDAAEILRYVESMLTNLQPHIPQACYPGRAAFIDNYIDPVLERVRAALSQTMQPQATAGEQAAAVVQPVAEWQYRTRPTWKGALGWTEWAKCSEGTAREFLRTNVRNDWVYEVRALYLAAPGAREQSRAVDVDALAQEIRRVDGSNSLGACALAEALMPFLTALDTGEK